MRGCATLLLGLAVGVALMALSWPSTPTGVVLPGQSDVRVSLSDAYLTRRVQARVSSTGIISVRHIHVTSVPPALIVRADAALGPVSAPITVELQPLVRAGDVQVRIITTRIGIVPLPSVLTDLVTTSINDSLHHIVGNNLRVTGATVTQHGLDITANNP